MIHSICIRMYLVTAQAVTAGTGILARRLEGARGEKGQASAEYALVMLGAALLAIFIGKWATQGDTLPRIFKRIIDTVLDGMPG